MNTAFDLASILAPAANCRSFPQVSNELKGDGLFERIHACRHGCCLFEGDLLMKDTCPHCGFSRYEADGVTPVAVFLRFDLARQLTQRFQDPGFSSRLHVSTPADAQLPPSNLYSRPAWQAKVTKATDGFADPANWRNLLLTLCIDGVNLWRGAVHSMTPLVVRMENLPGTERNRSENLLLWGLIQGQPAD
jgi:hypothetical protein